MTPVEQNIGFFNVGTTFDVVLPILRNDCDYFVSDVEVALTIPPGLEVDSYVIPKGEYLNGVWTAGGLTPGQYAEATFTFIVIDPCENPTSIQFSISAASVCDDCFTITDYEVRISGISCCKVSECLGYNTGNVLYVSVNGDNNTAVKGDPTRPWRTPQDARDSASDGDLIHVFPGVYTYGNEGSGADYEGTSDVNAYRANWQISLNYGKTNISYYLEPNVLLQEVGATQPLIYDPWDQNPESPSIVRVYGYGEVSCPLSRFAQIVCQDSDWELNFKKVTSLIGVAFEANYISVGGLNDTPYFKRFILNVDNLTCTQRHFTHGTGNSVASSSRVGLSRGELVLNVKTANSTATNTFTDIGYLYNYDIHINIGHIRNSDFAIRALKDTLCRIDIGTFEDSGATNNFGYISELSVMTDAVIHLNVREWKSSATSNTAGIFLRNRYGTGGKVFIRVDNLTYDNCILCTTQASADARVTLHNGGFEGDTLVTISGQYVELDGSRAVMEFTGTAKNDGNAGNLKIKFKDASLITAHTDCIDSTFAKNVILQNVVSNKTVGGNITIQGQALLVDTDFTY